MGVPVGLLLIGILACTLATITGRTVAAEPDDAIAGCRPQYVDGGAGTIDNRVLLGVRRQAPEEMVSGV